MMASASAIMAKPTVKLASTNLGEILVDSSGYTVYEFTRDRRRQDRCVQVSGCLSVWPALTVKGKSLAGAQVKHSLLGTTKFRGTLRQVTYAGHPLYTYSGDFGPRSTDYAGSYEYGGAWYPVNRAGRAVGNSGL
jgi:predicted lipoprotein with Yx(FWY)xxD motif